MKRALALLWLLTGCLTSNPAKGVASTGAPLVLKSESGTGTYRSNDVVGEFTVRDMGGNAVGTVEQTAVREHAYAWHTYHYEQDGKKLDEQDFYRLAGDHDSEKRVAHHRRRARRVQKIGLYTVIGNVIAAGALMSYGISIDSTGITLLSLIPLTVGIPVGGIMMGAGRRRMRDQVIEEKRAEEVAEVIDRCLNNRCQQEPGGARFRGSDGASLRMRDEVPVPPTAPAPVATLVGTWRGNVTMNIVRAGGKKAETTDATIEIIQAGEGTIEVNLDTERNKMCKVRGLPRGNRATLEPSTCRVTDGGQQMEIQYAGGSVELRGSELVLDASATITATSKGRRDRAAVTWKGVLAASH